MAFNLKEKQKQTKNKNRKEKRRIAETRIARIRLAHSTKTRNPKGPGTSKHRDSGRTDPHNVHKTLQQQQRTATTNAAYKRAHNELSRTCRHGWMDGWE